jgi:hypothetical protein
MRWSATALLPLLFACSPPRTQYISANDTTFILNDQRDADAISAAYHERVRLGLGSPFRVIEIAAHDQRLRQDDRERLLADLFERIEDGDIYEIGATLPLAHYRVIEHALNSTYDPRIAELAVNLAYEVAAAEQTVTPALQFAAAGTIALMRDRALAQRDAKHVRSVARTHDLAPHTLVPAMRAQRALLVEQPLEPLLGPAAGEDASTLAVMLIGGVRQAARAPVRFDGEQEAASRLDRDVAERILALQRAHERPPQSAIIIAMRAAQLPIDAQNEETFVAQLALAPAQTSLAAQRAALALRPFAQQRVQAAAPSGTELLKRHGVRVVFGPEVPEQWHGYYRAELGQALADLEAALPGITLTGLTFEIADVAPDAAHLAYHDPRARIIGWPPATGSGSLAHEIAHDLDWQIARRSYGKAGYASDLALDLKANLKLTRAEGGTVRATELFARQFDWVVATALAAQGRLNGQLTSVQHDWLPGHGSALPPLANSRSANTLSGMVQRGGRLPAAGQETLERALQAAALPPAVHAVRQLRYGTERLAGPRRSLFETTAHSMTTEYVALLARAAGAAPPWTDPATAASAIDPKAFYLTPYY